MNTGWWAVPYKEAPDARYQWSPTLQCPGHDVNLDIWFASEDDCMEFIYNDVIGQGGLHG